MYSCRLKLLQSMQLKSISWLLPRITPGASMIFQQDLASHRSPPPSTHMNTALAHMLTVINMQINMRDYFTRLARLQDKRDILLHHSIRMVLSLELEPLILLLKFGMWRLRYDLVLGVTLFKNIFRWPCSWNTPDNEYFLSVVKGCNVRGACWTSHCYVLLWKWLLPSSKYFSINAVHTILNLFGVWYSPITLQTAAHDGVKLWDLRKLRNFRTLSPYDSDTPTNAGK